MIFKVHLNRIYVDKSSLFRSVDDSLQQSSLFTQVLYGFFVLNYRHLHLEYYSVVGSLLFSQHLLPMFDILGHLFIISLQLSLFNTHPLSVYFVILQYLRNFTKDCLTLFDFL